jgi:hypothetical protein
MTDSPNMIPELYVFRYSPACGVIGACVFAKAGTTRTDVEKSRFMLS